MQVAHQADHVTHAVLGGQANISFGISDDPAFFQILSSALYKDPMLAMVRETICNAWDAHIDNGIEDRPLLITLDSEHLVIRDFGKGIPKDLIGPIYGVYGASTKKNDGRQTGGFGLGCKSPFAYTDHFEVISHHGGEKTIYRMSKSSAEKLGKPSIVPIATFPTTETGIQVKIPLKGDNNDQRISGLVSRVIFNGDILAMVNGQQPPVLGLNKAESKFILINDSAESKIRTDHFEGRIFVRYGNVIYPVENSTEYDALWSRVYQMMHNKYHCRLVMMAPPDSISITPSRESLTQSELTVETVKTLLAGFLAHMVKNREIAERHEDLLVEYVDKAVKSPAPLSDKLVRVDWTVPGIPANHDTKFLSTVDHFASLEVMLKYSGRSGTVQYTKWFPIMKQYLEGLMNAGHIKRSMVQTWLNYARKGKKKLTDPSKQSWNYRHWVKVDGTSTWSEVRIATEWWRKMVMLPVLNKVQNAVTGFHPRDLWCSNDNATEHTHKGGHRALKRVGSVQLLSHTVNIRAMLKPAVVLCHNVDLIQGRLSYIQQMDRQDSWIYGECFVVNLDRSREDIQKIVETLKADADISVIDMTGRLSHEEDAYQRRKASAAKSRAEKAAAAAAGKPVRVKASTKDGLIRMDQLLTEKGSFYTPLFLQGTDPLRIKEPLFIELISTAEDSHTETKNFGSKASKAIAKLWGSLGSITNNSGVFARIQEKGVKSLEQFVMDKVSSEIGNNAEIKQFMNYSETLAVEYLHEQQVNYKKLERVMTLYRLVLCVPEFSHYMPNFKPLSDTDQLRLVIWDDLKENYSWKNRDNVAQAVKDLGVAELPKEAKNFLDKISASSFLGLLEEDSAGSTYSIVKNDPAELAKFVSIINLIIN